MNTNRRSFLGGMAAASVLTSSAGAASASTATVENPDLLALGAEFNVALTAFEAAAARLAERRGAYGLIAPALPASITFDEYERRLPWSYTEILQDVTSERRGDVTGPHGFRIRIVTTENIDRHFTNSELPETLKALRARAARYERELARALAKSGLTDALRDYGLQEDRLRKTTRDLAHVRSCTPAGLGLKVRATAIYAALVPLEKMYAAMWLADAVWHDLGEEA